MLTLFLRILEKLELCVNENYILRGIQKRNSK